MTSRSLMRIGCTGRSCKFFINFNLFLLYFTFIFCMNHYPLCLVLPLQHRGEAVLFACLLFSRTIMIGRLLGPKMKNGIKCLHQGHSDVL